MADKASKHYYFMDLEFWANNGMVTVLDGKRAGDGREAADCIFHMSPGEFIKRAISVRMTLGDKYPDERRRASRFMEEAMIVAKLARRQGDLSDPDVIEHEMRHGRSRQIVVPGLDVRSPALAGIDYKVETGKDPRNVMLRGDYEVTSDFSIKTATPRPKPKRKRKKR